MLTLPTNQSVCMRPIGRSWGCLGDHKRPFLVPVPHHIVEDEPGTIVTTRMTSDRLLQLVDVFGSNLIPTKAGTLKVRTIDTHDIVDTQRPLLGVDKQLTLHPRSMVPFSEHPFQNVSCGHIGFHDKGVNGFVWVNNVNKILFHYPKRITP